MSMLRTLASWAAVAVLSGCAGLPAPGERLPPAPAFDLVGRVAVTYDGRAFSSGVRWQHQPNRDEIWLMTPTGQALAHIEADAAGATLTGADQSQYQAADVEQLTERALGWELPLARLAWWVRGEPVPGAVPPAEALRDTQGRLVRLQQDGWGITYGHAAASSRDDLPQRLDMQRNGHRIRFVIDGWR